MAITLKVPKLAVSMQAGTLQQWLVPDGTTVTAGQPIYTIEADKALQDIEAPVAGVLHQCVQGGASLMVGEKLGEILEAGDIAEHVTDK